MIKSKTSKYHATATTVDGIRFASKKEAKRYGELKLLQMAGQIRDLTLQPKYVLCAPNFHWNIAHGITGNPAVGEYRADFAYFDRRAGEPVVEDVKGFKTPLYRWKKKHVEAQYGIRVMEI